MKLLDELTERGVKFNADEVVEIIKTREGKIIWLEKGTANAGLEHIMKHADQFASKGILQNDISNFIIYSVQYGKVVGMQRTRTIYEVLYKGKIQHVAITISDNGFIVGANPK